MISKQTETKSNEINYILIAVLKKKLIKNKIVHAEPFLIY